MRDEQQTNQTTPQGNLRPTTNNKIYSNRKCEYQLKYCHVTNYPKKRKEGENKNDMNYRSIIISIVISQTNFKENQLRINMK